MQIGEFAKQCQTNISLLRHYDKLGLLCPAFTDKVTGYRYYSPKQAEIFEIISKLKKSGFSLDEIKKILDKSVPEEEIADLFAVQKTKLTEMLTALEEAKNNLKESDYMSNEELRFNENIDFPFENDPQAVGKWKTLGIWHSADDYYLGKEPDTSLYGETVREIYFLPGSEPYWGYSWTKGKLLDNEYMNPRSCNYRIETTDSETLMFIDYKSYEYLVSGKTELLVLKKLDSVAYSSKDIARKDNIDMPFVDDPSVIGKWKTWGFCRTKEDFSTEPEPEEYQYWKSVEFFPGGSVTSVYEDEVIEGDDRQTWTKNYLLRKFNWSACEYEIRNVDGDDYMIIEWKSGDYRWGGFDTNYYIFKRDKN